MYILNAHTAWAILHFSWPEGSVVKFLGTTLAVCKKKEKEQQKEEEQETMERTEYRPLVE